MIWRMDPNDLADLIGLDTQGERWDALVSACAAYREFTPIFEQGELANIDEFGEWQFDFLDQLEAAIGERDGW